MEPSVGQTGWQTLFHCTTAHFSSLCKLHKTVPVTTLLMFGPVTLLYGLKCGTFLLYYMSERPVWSSGCEHRQVDRAQICTSGSSIHMDAGSRLLQLWHYLRRRIRETVPPLHISNSHSDDVAENQHMIPALKGRCESSIGKHIYREQEPCIHPPQPPPKSCGCFSWVYSHHKRNGVVEW